MAVFRPENLYSTAFEDNGMFGQDTIGSTVDANSIMQPSVVTGEQFVQLLLANPNATDQEIVKSMEALGVSPAQLSQAIGVPEGQIIAKVASAVPNGQAVLLGDTWVQPNYQTTGSGENQQVNGLENIFTYKVGENVTGGGYTQYNPTGEVERTGVQQKVDSGLKEFALGAGALFGGAALAGLGGGATAIPAAAELAQANMALGGVGGTAGATELASALATGAPTVATTALTGGSGLITGANAGITAESIASQLAADAGTGGLLSSPAIATPVVAPTYVAPVAEVGPVFNPYVAPEVLPELAQYAAPVAPSLASTVAPAAASAVAPTVASTVAPATASTTGGLLSSVLPASGTIGGTLARGVLSTLGSNAMNSLLGNSSNLSNLISGGLGTAGNLLQMQQSKEAAQKAQAMIDAETAAAKQAAQFRPVGMTTRFGTSQFQVDPTTGQLVSAGYTLSPEAKAQQDRLVALQNQGLTQAEQAQAQFAPLQTGAQSLFNLGNQYLAQSPQDVAKNYLNQQLALLQPGRELELANLQNRLQQQGRSGLSVAQGGTYGATTPELQALYNARAMQEAQLAAQAQQAGQQQVQFGAGLLGQGANAMGQYYGGQTAAYQPYTTALGQVQALEAAGQQPFTMSTGLGQAASQAGANVGRFGLTGAQLSTNLATSADATRNLAAQGLIAAGNPSAMFGSTINNLLGGLFGGTPVNALDSSAYGTGTSGFQNMLNDIYG